MDTAFMGLTSCRLITITGKLSGSDAVRNGLRAGCLRRVQLAHRLVHEFAEFLRATAGHRDLLCPLDRVLARGELQSTMAQRQSFFSFWASITRIPLGPRRYVSLYSSR